MRRIPSLSRAEFRSVQDRLTKGKRNYRKARLTNPFKRRKTSLKQRLVGRTLLGRAVRVAGAAGVAGGGYALLRRKGGGIPKPAVGGRMPGGGMPKPRSAKKLANSAKVARRRANIGKAAKALQGGTKGRTSAERRIISSRVKKGASAARSRLGANYRSSHRLVVFSRFYH